MDKISLQAQERTILGKKVKNLRRDGIIPGHVFGNNKTSENISVNAKDFLAVYHRAGETGLINLKIGEEKIRPVLIRQIQHDPVRGQIQNVDFYQVNLKEKVKVPVPIELIGEGPESVKMGETVVLQNLLEIEVEALPTDLIEKFEVSVEPLKNVEDAITVSQLNYNRETLTVLADPEEVVVKLAPAITEEMKALLEEQKAEAEAAAAEQAAEEGAEVKTEGEEGAEAEGAADESVEAGGGEEGQQESQTEEKKEEPA